MKSRNGKSNRRQSALRPAVALTLLPKSPNRRKKEKNPFLDNDFEDMEIINETAPAKVDPYASNTWKVDQDADTRKLKTLHLVSGTEQDNSEDFNPYDTGVFRRGWKD